MTHLEVRQAQRDVGCGAAVDELAARRLEVGLGPLHGAQAGEWKLLQGHAAADELVGRKRRSKGALCR